MTAFDPDPSLRWLFAMTHPDDELAVGAWIRRLTRAGADVFMSWTHSNGEREEEARSAAEFLGVRQDRLTFFGSPDGRVLEDLVRLLPLFSYLISDVQPHRVVCGAFEQGHLDHDSTNFLVNSTFEGAIFETPLYHTYADLIQTVNRFADPSAEEVWPLEGEYRDAKRRLAQLFPSQRIADNLRWYTLYRWISGRPVDLAGTERLRLQTHRDFLTPNLPAHMAQRVRRTAQWRRWEATLRGLLGA